MKLFPTLESIVLRITLLPYDTQSSYRQDTLYNVHEWEQVLNLFEGPPTRRSGYYWYVAHLLAIDSVRVQ